MNTKNTLYAVVGLVIVVGSVLFGYWLHAPKQLAGAVSPAGTSNGNRQYSSIVVAPLTLTSTSSSILNQSTDREVTDIVAECTGANSSSGATGAGVANLVLHIATSTLANSTLDNNTQYLFNGTIATSSLFEYVASSTGSIQTSSATGATTAFLSYWPSGSYLNFAFNATNTAVCTLAANWISL